MQKLSVFISIVLALVLIACSNNPVGLDNSKETGKILLKIDKQNAPASVVLVKAYLTRENYQPIAGTLNLQSDSTADLLLNDIAAGEWHLKVDAKDSSGTVLYTGETDVQIFAGFTSQVYLTLSPTGAGTGSIFISVNWGVPVSAWMQQNSGTYLQLRDVFFINENLGWVVGEQGKVLKTTNAGNQWQNVQLNTSVSLNSVWFVSQEVGFISGAGGMIFKTSDGGLSWSSKYIGNSISVYEVQFLNNVGYAACDDGIVCKTTNFGDNWTIQYSSTYASLLGLKILNEQNIISAGQGGIINRTSNGGNSWLLVNENPNHQWIQAIDFCNISVGYTVSGYGVMLKTTDSGNNWYKISSPTNEHLEDIQFINSNVGYIVGNHGKVFKTNNSGENWSEINSGTNKWLNSVFFINENNGWIVGSDGIILRYHN